MFGGRDRLRSASGSRDYSYAINSPTNQFDPFGLSPQGGNLLHEAEAMLETTGGVDIGFVQVAGEGNTGDNATGNTLAQYDQIGRRIVVNAKYLKSLEEGDYGEGLCSLMLVLLHEGMHRKIDDSTPGTSTGTEGDVSAAAMERFQGNETIWRYCKDKLNSAVNYHYDWLVSSTQEWNPDLSYKDAKFQAITLINTGYDRTPWWSRLHERKTTATRVFYDTLISGHPDRVVDWESGPGADGGKFPPKKRELRPLPLDFNDVLRSPSRSSNQVPVVAPAPSEAGRLILSMLPPAALRNFVSTPSVSDK